MTAVYECPGCGCRGVWRVYDRHNGCPECRESVDTLRETDPVEVL